MARIRPDQQPDRVRLLQSALLTVAEEFFGTRDMSFTLSAARFHERGPYIQHAATGKRLWAELSRNAAGYWPTAVYELAHECVHFLNPVVGNTNFLEEGFAVAFQHFVAPSFSGEDIATTHEIYLKAEHLVNQLSDDVFHAGKLIREHTGAFSKATPANLAKIFPNADRKLLRQLAAKCRTR